MKHHISQKAIGQVAYEYGSCRAKQRISSGFAHEYWLGKQIGIANTFAYLTGQTYNNAEDMLSTRYRLEYEV